MKLSILFLLDVLEILEQLLVLLNELITNFFLNQQSPLRHVQLLSQEAETPNRLGRQHLGGSKQSKAPPTNAEDDEDSMPALSSLSPDKQRDETERAGEGKKDPSISAGQERERERERKRERQTEVKKAEEKGRPDTSRRGEDEKTERDSRRRIRPKRKQKRARPDKRQPEREQKEEREGDVLISEWQRKKRRKRYGAGSGCRSFAILPLASQLSTRERK